MTEKEAERSKKLHLLASRILKELSDSEVGANECVGLLESIKYSVLRDLEK